MSQNACCKRLTRDEPSPFELVQLGWWDGLTSGMARCRACSATYYFDMISWAFEHEVRIYGFREISRAGYDSVEELCAGPAPSADQRQQHDAALLRRVRDALATNYETSLYVASANLAERIVSARTISFDAWMGILAA